MPGRISELAALSAPASGDLMEVTDVSDTTMASSGTSKKMSLAPILNATVPRFAYNNNTSLGHGGYYRVTNQKGWSPDSITARDDANGRAWMLWLPCQGGSLATVLINVSTAGDAGAKVRLAVYAVNAGIHITVDAIIGTLIVDSGQLDASTTGTKQMTGLDIPIPSEGLFLACCNQNMTTLAPTIHCLNTDAWPPGIGPESVGPGGDIWNNRGGGICFNGVTGAYPAQPTSLFLSQAGIGYLVPDFKVQYR